MAGTYRQVDTKALDELVRANLFFRENSQSFVFDCPRCLKKEKLYMYKKDGRFVCWVCKDVDGFQGRPEFALRELLALPMAELRTRLYGEAAPQAVERLEIRLKDFWGEGEEPDADAYELAEVAFPPDFYPIDHKHSGKGREYLAKRGVTPEVAQRYALRYCPPQQRLIFPIGAEGRLYGWQGRHVGVTEYEDPDTGEVFTTPKVTTTKGLKKEYTFMFIDRLIGSTHAVLTEGPFDGIKADLCGGNIVSMGKAVSKAQLNILRNAGIQKLYVGLDPDAFQEIIRICQEIGSDLELYQVRPPAAYHDLGEMNFEEVRSAFDSAPRINSALHFAFVEEDFATLRRRKLKYLSRPRRSFKAR